MRKYKDTIALAICALFIFLSLFVGGGGVYASAVVEGYSAVADDLQKDENFNAWDYPALPSDYSLKVIQIAENPSGELFIYVYQPSGQVQKLTATCVNMSLSETVEGTKLYDLSLVSSSGVFFKYRVDDFTVKKLDDLRYYNITSIYRPYNNFIDKGAATGNTRDEVAFTVGQLWAAHTDENGEISYDMRYTEVIRILNPYAGCIAYFGNSPLLFNYLIVASKKYQFVDSHYIAFSTDYDIDRLISADLSYVYRDVDGYYSTLLAWDWGEVHYGDYVASQMTVTYEDKATISESDFWGFKHEYSWDRIVSVSEFLENEKNLTETDRNNVWGKQWVLRFLETERTQKETDILPYKGYSGTYVEVSKVTILRLEFEMDGKVYNLGAVSDKVTVKYPEKENDSFWDKIFPATTTDGGFSMPWWGWGLIIVGAIIVIILIVKAFKNRKNGGG